MNIVLPRVDAQLQFLGKIYSYLNVAGTIIGLYQNNLAVTVNTILTDLVVATFTGYGVKPALHSVAPFINGAGNVETQAPSVSWTPTDGVNPNIIYGAYILDAPGNLLYIMPFDQGYSMVDALSTLTIVPRIAMPASGWPMDVEPM
jgi:hypothetical protein